MLTSVSRLCRKLTYRRHLRESEAHFGQIRLQAAHPQWQIRLQAAHPQWQIQPPRLRPSLANQPPGTRLLEGQVGRACFQHGEARVPDILEQHHARRVAGVAGRVDPHQHRVQQRAGAAVGERVGLGAAGVRRLPWRRRGVARPPRQPLGDAARVGDEEALGEGEPVSKVC